MPGGLGIADGALVGGAMRFILSPALDVDQGSSGRYNCSAIDSDCNVVAWSWFGSHRIAQSLFDSERTIKKMTTMTLNRDDQEPLTTNDDEAH